jgi:thioredoxin reductase (NADPH)
MTDTATSSPNAIAFPRLDANDLAALKPLAESCSFEDGQTIFRAGDADLDLYVVESGGIEILNPSDENRHVVTHGPGQFAGDIDLLTRRPVIVTGIARGPTRLMRVPGARLRELLNKVPRLSEKLLIAIQERRRLLTQAGVLGLRVVGPGKCRDTMVVREFLFKNFVPFTWYDSVSQQGLKLMANWGSPKKTPVIECGHGKLLINPGLRELAEGAGVWRHCPTDSVDLAVIGAGPAGMTAAVYAASEGLSTIVLDRLGPGGQASGSSKIENFIGFPSGLSGAELAMRGVLQMLKFGAKMVAPVTVQRIEPPASPGDHHILELDCGTRLRARTVLIAAGVHWRKLEADGAERFESSGIHYACTSVEAILYDKQDVAVVGAGNSAGQASAVPVAASTFWSAGAWDRGCPNTSSAGFAPPQILPFTKASRSPPCMAGSDWRPSPCAHSIPITIRKKASKPPKFYPSPPRSFSSAPIPAAPGCRKLSRVTSSAIS